MAAGKNQQLAILFRLLDIFDKSHQQEEAEGSLTTFAETLTHFITFYGMLAYVLEPDQDSDTPPKLVFSWFSHKETKLCAADKHRLCVMPPPGKELLVWANTQPDHGRSDVALIQPCCRLPVSSGVAVTQPCPDKAGHQYLLHLLLRDPQPSSDQITFLKRLQPIITAMCAKFTQSKMKNECLTPREQEALLWMARGKSVWAIGKIMQISERTVKFHSANIFRKLEVSNRTQAVAAAMKIGIINPMLL